MNEDFESIDRIVVKPTLKERIRRFYHLKVRRDWQEWDEPI